MGGHHENNPNRRADLSRLLSLGLFGRGRADGSGSGSDSGSDPTPAAAPLIAGTWKGTLTSGGTTTCPITLEIEQPNAG